MQRNAFALQSGALSVAVHAGGGAEMPSAYKSFGRTGIRGGGGGAGVLGGVQRPHVAAHTWAISFWYAAFLQRNAFCLQSGALSTAVHTGCGVGARKCVFS